MATLYPLQIDTSANLFTVVDNSTPVEADVVNRLRDAIIAVESELGVKPSSIYGTVRYRLDTIETIVGSIVTGSLSAGGDLSGIYPNPTVIKLQSNAVKQDTLGSNQDGYVLTWVNGNLQWEAKSIPAGFSAGGDLFGTTTNQTVIAIQNNAVQSGILNANQDGYVLTWLDGYSQYRARPVTPVTVLVTGRQLSFTSTSSDISTYFNLQDLSTGSDTDSSVTITSGSGKTLIKSFATTLGSLNILTIPQGIWEFDYYRYVDSAVGSSTITFDGYVRTAGGLETLLFTVTSPDINDTTAILERLQVATTSSTSVNATDRLVIKVSANTSGGSITIHFVYDGIIHPSSVKTTIVGGSIQLGGDLFGNSESATVTRIYNNAVASTALSAIQDGYVLTWVNGSNEYQQKPIPVQFTASGDLSGTSTNQNVINIHGASVPIAGGLTTGNGLYVTGTSALTYSALNLAGGVNYVIGTLPTANQVSQIMLGDVTGTTAASVVVKINGTSVQAAPSANNILVATGTTTSVWSQIVDGYISSSAAIAVNKLAAGTSAQVLLNNATPIPTWTTISGDTTISATGAASVIRIQGNPVLSATYAAAQDGYVHTWVNGSTQIQMKPIPTQTATGSANGDLSGTYPSPTVAKINGASVYAAGSLTTGNGLYVSDASALTYSALNLAGGINYVTGVLPSANQASQTMLGDVTGTTAASVVSLITGVSGTLALASTAAIINWAAASASPKITQITQTSDIAPNVMTIQSQAPFATATLTNRTPGDLIFIVPPAVASGTEAQMRFRVGSTSADLAVLKQNGGTTSAWFQSAANMRVEGLNGIAVSGGANSCVIVATAGTSFGTAATSGITTIVPISAGITTMLTSAASTGFTLGFADKTTNSTVGANLLLKGQNETGLGSAGGNVNLTAGTGTNTDGYVLVNGHLGIGIFSQAMADSNQTVSIANSINNMIVATGTVTTTKTLTLTCPPAAGLQKTFRNNSTGSITISFLSGTGLTVLTNTSIIFYGDGTNAVLLMSGT